MNKLRIAQFAPLWESVPPPLYGGIERIVYYLLKGLSKRGHEVTLFASGDSTKEFPLVSITSKALFRDPDVKRPQAYNYLMLKELLKRSGDFDIIHDHTFYEPVILAPLIKPKIVHTLHLEVVPEIQKLFNACPEVVYVAISNSQKQNSGINIETVIYNGIDTSLYKFNDKPNGDYLVWLGRISHIKGTKEAILVAQKTGDKLLIAGKVNKEDEEYYQKEIKPLIDNQQIKYIGEVDDVKKSALLGNAKALINPINWAEPFGLVAVEALACGTPVIANNIGAMPEIITESRTGFLTDRWQEMPAKLSHLNQINRSECRKVVDDKFSLQRMTDGYEALYNKLSGNNKP